MYLVGDVIPQHMRPKLTDFGQECVLANLEGPICADGLPVSNKVGVCLHSAPFDVPANWSFALANNHFMDYRERGLVESLEFLELHGCKYAGAGRTVSEARKPMWLSESEKRLAVFSCCERQFGIASADWAGVAEKGLWLFSAIREARNQGADFVIVSCHAGSEFSPFVNPRLREFYHALVDAGADVIHGHHAHVPQGWETYKGRPIFYGLGNYIVDSQHWGGNPHYGWSIVANVDFRGKALKWTVDFSGNLPSNHREYVDGINAGFGDERLLESLWQEASMRLYSKLYEQNLRAPSTMCHRLSGRDCLRKLYFVLGDIKRILRGCEMPTERSLHYAKVLYNFVNCESHYQAISTALGIMSGAEEDLRCALSNSYAERCFSF